MFWAWLLKYSSFFITGVVTFIVGYILNRVTTARSELISYNSHQQYVNLPPQKGQGQGVGLVGTFTLFLWNSGKAPAKDVQIGHYFIPAHNVWPDIPRKVEQTPGGNWTLTFAMIPPKTVVSISYLFFGVYNVDQIISYVNWEQGTARRIPVLLQRIWPKWYRAIWTTIFFLGLWTSLNILLSMIEYLWKVYYK